MKCTTEMSWDELVDWAAGYLLQELIAGRFRSGVHMVIDQAVRWRDEQEKKSKKK